ncbi:hypothetical protein [Bradyrhizobium septentrionale]|uniref:Uncharacterized protein n=1 Tax=Bradyrhizobium septentrionale TaxID=1404411 RepID=A0A973W562_9BRAD|nr:hypothetical protein [Bradyrhizobium septentrionale]UGY16490.1 hypothetical protein HAP48_0002700 [Bradyrhizobium septentrionale]UGY25149.1 hypothetical protein HU675_0046065 [Bradyrhizobium septentrionale]
MKRPTCAFIIAAIFAVASAAVANAQGAGIRPVGDRSRAGEPYRGYPTGRHDSRPPVRSDGRERGWPSGSYPLEYEDRDRGVYLGQRHDD